MIQTCWLGTLSSALVKRNPNHEKGEDTMKAGIFFTGSGPIVILTSYTMLTAPNFVEKLAAKGITKFIAYEVEVEEVKKKVRQALRGYHEGPAPDRRPAGFGL